MDSAFDLRQIVLILVQLPLAFMVLYLDVLSVAALFWRQTVQVTPLRRRFAILVPAHNEEILLPRLLQSLTDLTYPRHLFEIYVVADNCSDRTGELAHAGGAHVYHRTDESEIGKGYALRWLLAELERDNLQHDAFVVVDAESVVSSNFRVVFNK